jgi:hypothetical protein
MWHSAGLNSFILFEFQIVVLSLVELHHFCLCVPAWHRREKFDPLLTTFCLGILQTSTCHIISIGLCIGVIM